MNLSKKLFNTVFSILSLCLFLTLISATPTMAQGKKEAIQVNTSIDQGNGDPAVAKKRNNDSVGSVVVVETILRVAIKRPKPNLHITSVKVFQLKNGGLVMDEKGCLATTCEYDIAHLPSGLYRVKVHTNHANKGFGKTVYIH